MPCTVYQSVHRFEISRARVTAVVRRTLSLLRHPSASLSIHFIGDRRMRRLNTAYRGRPYTTDVLAFAAQEGYAIDKLDWGDIFISVPQIRRQARKHHLSFEEECIRMLIHGILHLAGFDHIVRREARQMFRLQERLVSESIRNPKGSAAFFSK